LLAVDPRPQGVRLLLNRSSSTCLRGPGLASRNRGLSICETRSFVALIGLGRIEVLPLHGANRPGDVAIPGVHNARKRGGKVEQECIAACPGERPSCLEDGSDLTVGQSERLRHCGGFRGGCLGIRDLASLSKTLARNRKSCTGVAATKGLSPRLRRQGGMLWRDLRAAIKTEMAARRQVMKQSDRAKGSERAVALMVERIKSTTSYAQMGARAGITAERARELVARGVRKVAYGNAECNLSKDDLKTARLRNRLSPWDIGLLEHKLFGAAETRWQIDDAGG
jgi:hypothetical protein